MLGQHLSQNMKNFSQKKYKRFFKVNFFLFFKLGVGKFATLVQESKTNFSKGPTSCGNRSN